MLWRPWALYQHVARKATVAPCGLVSAVTLSLSASHDRHHGRPSIILMRCKDHHVRCRHSILRWDQGDAQGIATTARSDLLYDQWRDDLWISSSCSRSKRRKRTILCCRAVQNCKKATLPRRAIPFKVVLIPLLLQERSLLYLFNSTSVSLGFQTSVWRLQILQRNVCRSRFFSSSSTQIDLCASSLRSKLCSSSSFINSSAFSFPYRRRNAP